MSPESGVIARSRKGRGNLQLAFPAGGVSGAGELRSVIRSREL